MTSASYRTAVPATKTAPFYVRLPRVVVGKVVSVVRLVVLAVAGLAAVVAALIALDAALLGDSKRKH